jgi:endonuclease/exonuclease/phosphatase family metal-dependent hydrolase
MSKITSINIRKAWTRKKALLEYLVHKTKPDIILIQEAGSAKIKIDGYITIQQKLAKGRTVGLATLIRNNIKHTELDMTASLTEGNEFLGIAVPINGNRTNNIINCYISQNKINTMKIVDILTQHTNTYIFGDLNSKLDIPIHQRTNQNGERLQISIDSGEISAVYPLTPTRLGSTDDQEDSVIDYVLTNGQKVNSIESIYTEENIGSDHLPVTIQLKTRPLRNTAITTEKPNFDKADWGRYSTLVEKRMTTAPEISPNKDSIDQAIEFLIEAIKTCDRLSIPRTKILPSGAKPLPPHVLELIRKRRSFLKISRDTRHSNEIRKQAKSLANSLQNKIKQESEEAHRDHLDKKWQNTVDKTPHGFWKMAQHLLGTGKSALSTYPLKNEAGRLIIEDKEKCEIFRKLYETIYQTPEAHPDYQITDFRANALTNEIRNTFSEIRQHTAQYDFDTKVGVQDIVFALRNAKNTAPGTDGIYYSHIRRLPVTALVYLGQIYQTCIECIYFPDIWKQGTTILIPKPNKNQSDPKSYRPITLLSALGKVLERIINHRLKTHIETNSLFPPSQAGFRAGRSTQDQLFRLVQDITTAFQKYKTVLATFFDIEKAFDKLWIEGLTLKMKEHLKLKPGTIGLILNFLTNRTVRFKIGNELSSPLELKAGTPQGSILSPTLFNMGVSDIPQPQSHNNSVQLSQYADDIGTWTTGKDQGQTIPELTAYNSQIVQWCKEWKIKLAPEKTQLIEFKRLRPNEFSTPEMNINGTIVKALNNAKFLGITLHKRYILNSQHRETINQMKQRVRVLSRVTGTREHPRASEKLGTTILKSMIYSLTQYAPTIQVLKSDKQFEEQDKIIISGMRKVLHLGKSISGTYVRSLTDIEPTRDKTLRLAKNYLENDRRSRIMKDVIDLHKRRKTNKLQRHVQMTPIDAMYPDR